MNKDNSSVIDKYDHREIEPKWLEKWEKVALYKAVDFDKRPKKYILVEFPYPSGAGLHPGTFRSWGAMDAFSRKLRMQGFNVLYPMGWDAFGLPAENYALRIGVHPTITARDNIKRYKEQCRRAGLSFDWSREIDTTDPKYYKWTQWIFLKLLEKNMAYQAETQVNWCPFCKTTLADEEVLTGGIHERCGKPTEKRMQKQWLLRITKYADRLIEDLKTVDYSSNVSVQQVNWIGRSEGAEVEFRIKNLELSVKVFTTRADTLYGVTFMVIAPEHKLVDELTTEENRKAVTEYLNQTKRKSEIERLEVKKEKTGVFTGSYAINPVSGKEIPIWVADYALITYGTGVVMGVPAHDQRDFDFAKKYGFEIIPVIQPKEDWNFNDKPYTDVENGKTVNCGEWNNLKPSDAIEKANLWIEQKGIGKKGVTYHLRDWIFSRQHYWGEPIPVVHCEKCGVVSVPEDQLPVELPYVDKYQPSGTGESPLAIITDWVNTKCPKCNGPAKRETDTMPNWAGSNWYFIRYIDPHNNEALASKELIKYWLPVDVYQGGFEHTTLHVLYSRFIYKFLYDIGVVPTSEPYKKRRPHGIIIGSDGRKLSKSFNNTPDLDKIIDAYGADTIRVYEAFMGPFDQMMPWSQEGIEGSSRFLKRVWNLVVSQQDTVNSHQKEGEKITRKLNQTIKKVTEDIEAMKFNTAIASLMEMLNTMTSGEREEDTGVRVTRETIGTYLKLLAPFAPFITEELWERIGNKFSIHQSNWPVYDPKLIEEEEVMIVVQVNGKIRDQFKVQSAKCKIKEEIEFIAKEREKIKGYLTGGVKKVIFVPGKLINFVV